MLYTYDKKTKSLIPCEETEFKAHGLFERQDMAKWIEENSSILGEELLIITTEYDKFDRTNERLDLLSIDQDGNLVVIELKRDDSGRNVDLQAVKYAAYCSTLRLEDIVDMYVKHQQQKGLSLTPDAAREKILDFIENDDFEELNDRPRIILVAREFRPEVTASVLWLRKFALDISCVKWDPYILSDNTMAINSSVLIPLPEAKDFIIQAEKKDVAEHTKSLTQTEYARFFLKAVERLNEIIPRQYPSPSPVSYYVITSGISGVHFELGFHGRPRSSLGVEMHFEKSNKETNLRIMSECLKFKDQLEKALNEEIIVQEDWGKNWSRFYIEKQQGKMTDDLLNWAVEKMSIFMQILQPELDKIRKTI